MRWQRYQLSKEVTAVLYSGHPWIFRTKLSSAAEVLKTGQWIRLFSAENKVIGYGIFDQAGPIGIRAIKIGETAPNAKWLREKLLRVLHRRDKLRGYTNAFRAVSGENDGFPGIVVDVYGSTAILQTYSPSVDKLGRWVAGVIVETLALQNLVWKLPVKRQSRLPRSSESSSDPLGSIRILRGYPPEIAKVTEGKQSYLVPIMHGQKTGAFLDLRTLRKWLLQRQLQGKMVLNLFSYTGTLGLFSAIAGAKEVWNVDVSKGALEFAEKHHLHTGTRFHCIATNAFEWVHTLRRNEMFDAIISDPPQMASKKIQLPTALAQYRKLYRCLKEHVRPRGILIACCCSSRIARSIFKKEITNILVPSFRLIADLKPEDDHPVGFPEGDYLKVLVFERRT